MKRIWIVDHYASEPEYGGYTRQYEFAKELARRGCDVTVISSSYSHFTFSYISEEKMFISPINEACRFVYLQTTPYTEIRAKARTKNMLSFVHAVNAARKGIYKEFGMPDIVVGASVHPFTWIAAYRAAKEAKARFFIEVRDLWPEDLINGGVITKKSIIAIGGKMLENIYYPKAEKIIASMPLAKKYFCGKLHMPEEKIAIIGQPLDCQRYDMLREEKTEEIPKEIREFMDGRFVCVFTGFYMDYEGVMVMLEAADKIKESNKDIRMLFVGSGPEFENMQAYSKAHALDNVLICGRISKNLMPSLLAKSNLCMAHLAYKDKPNALPYGTSKNKINEYLYSGVPIVYATENEGEDVEIAQAGFIIPPFDSEALCKAIQTLYQMPEPERVKIGQNGRNFIKENRSIEKIGTKLMKLFGE